MLNAFHDSVQKLMRKNVERRTLVENIGCIFLIMDEIVDRGVILELDPVHIASRSELKAVEDIHISNADQTLSSIFSSAKEQLKTSFFYS